MKKTKIKELGIRIPLSSSLRFDDGINDKHQRTHNVLEKTSFYTREIKADMKQKG